MKTVNLLKPFITVGTRPEIVKMAPIIHECERRRLEFFLLHTGQHYSGIMSSSFFDDMKLPAPDKNLGIGSGSQAEQTAKALVGIEKVLEKQQPDVVLVQGDTNAGLSAAIAAVKLQIPVGHVEAGLRSYDTRMPEEHNRRLTDHASAYLFAPTKNSAEILRKESVWGKVFVTGNTVIDALENLMQFALERSSVNEEIGLDEFALLTLHRAENVDNKAVLMGLVNGLIDLDTKIIFSAHPRTVKRLKQFGLLDRVQTESKIKLIEPASYLDFIALMKQAKFILTDSGGIQEEATAPSLNKRVFVLRISTERPEAVESGHVTVVGTDPEEFTEKIRKEVEKGLDKERPCPYGDGYASKRILDILVDELV